MRTSKRPTKTHSRRTKRNASLDKQIDNSWSKYIFSEPDYSLLVEMIFTKYGLSKQWTIATTNKQLSKINCARLICSSENRKIFYASIEKLAAQQQTSQQPTIVTIPDPSILNEIIFYTDWKIAYPRLAE